MITTTSSKAYCIKHKVIGHNPTVHQNHNQKAEWMPHQTKLKCRTLEKGKRKPRKEDYNLKSWLKTKTRSCEWIHLWPGEQNINAGPQQ